MSTNSYKSLERFALALTTEDSDDMSLVKFQKSNVPGHAQILHDGRWWDFPLTALIGGLFTIAPDVVQHPAPRNPLRPVR